ncbi:MAG: polysaccharide deacetylase family protein [Acidobacteriaceae bacterium]|nr:polysaccharide deacetylase family protein [Acidobacteriaceae bacterium]
MKELIIHSDDFGMCHSVNKATIRALAASTITSTSIMAPCPGFEEAAAHARSNPRLDIGVHLTLTSEWEHCRWGPITDFRRAPSLVEADHKFPADANRLIARADPGEIELELKAQIDRVFSAGICPTHIDSHQMALYGRQDFFRIYTDLARRYDLPFLFTHSAPQPEYLAADVLPEDIVLDGVFQVRPPVTDCSWQTRYEALIAALPEGTSQLTVHVGDDDPELQALTQGREHWNAAWRQRDLDLISSDRFRACLANAGIRLTGWRELKRPADNRRAIHSGPILASTE